MLKEIILKLVNKAAFIANSLKTSIRKFSRSSHYKRWKDSSSLKAGWDSRTRLIGEMIEPGSAVIEFGAGRMVLKDFLPQGCRYLPSDLVDRGSGTLICDLNAQPLPEFGQHDVAVFSGVLEYVNDVPSLINRLSGSVNTIISSYAVVESFPRNRRSQGWVNDFTTAEFKGIFERNGFSCTHIKEWSGQKIFKYTKKAS